MCDRPHPCSSHPLRVDSLNMTTFFGPEMPEPLSARTEKYLPYLPLEKDSNAHDLYSFGPVYNARLNFEIAKMAEIDFDDRICYVGPCRGNNLRHLISQLSLIHPVMHLVPGAALHETREEWAIEEAQENSSLLRRSEQSAEAFFREWRPEKGPHFDKIIVRDCFGLVVALRDFYADVVRALTPKRGRLLLVHRPDSLSSLPFHTPALMAGQKKSPSVSDVVEDLKAVNCEVEYEVRVIQSSVYVRVPCVLVQCVNYQLNQTGYAINRLKHPSCILKCLHTREKFSAISSHSSVFVTSSF